MYFEYFVFEILGVVGKQVEFILMFNLKIGVCFGYKNLLGLVQYVYLLEQYIDVINVEQDCWDNISGIIGVIFVYDILDVFFFY